MRPSKPRRTHATIGSALALAARDLLTHTTPAHAVIDDSGQDINALLGADTFYNAGYTGSHAIIANVEAGYVWNGHETLTGVNTFVGPDGSITTGGATLSTAGQALIDRHATWVGMMLAGQPTNTGYNTQQQGIASALRSGQAPFHSAGRERPTPAVSPRITPARYNAYTTVMSTGVNGKTADVINSSWGDSSDTLGNGVYSLLVDALANQTGKTVVIAAGNSETQVSGPAAGDNSIVVGSLGGTNYQTVSTFSNRGPALFYVPTNSAGTQGNEYQLTNAQGVNQLNRPTVDIVAPGKNLVSAFYGGTTGGNTGGKHHAGQQPVQHGPGRHELRRAARRGWRYAAGRLRACQLRGDAGFPDAGDRRPGDQSGADEQCRQNSRLDQQYAERVGCAERPEHDRRHHRAGASISPAAPAR